MWLEILKNLKTHMKAIEGVVITLGATLEDDYPNIQLIRGDTVNLTHQGRMMGAKHVIYVEIWVRNDEIDPEPAYEELYQYEQQIKQVLDGWFKVAGNEIGVTVIHAEIESIASDVDAFRPLCGSRFIINFEWRKKHEF